MVGPDAWGGIHTLWREGERRVGRGGGGGGGREREREKKKDGGGKVGVGRRETKVEKKGTYV